MDCSVCSVLFNQRHVISGYTTWKMPYCIDVYSGIDCWLSIRRNDINDEKKLPWHISAAATVIWAIPAWGSSNTTCSCNIDTIIMVHTFSDGHIYSWKCIIHIYIHTNNNCIEINHRHAISVKRTHATSYPHAFIYL